MLARKKIPWLALGLALIAYGVFGWAVAESSNVWSEAIVEQGKAWGLIIDDEYASAIIDLLGVSLIVAIALGLTAPIALVTICFGSWQKSETKAWISILGWSFAVVFILRWINYFARFLVLLCAALLARLEFQSAGYNSWQTFVILTLACLSGFGLGVFSFWQLGQ
jgi:hypothetical protein